MTTYPETKTWSKTTLSYGPDINSKIYVIHSIASYLVTSEGGACIYESEGGVKWILPPF